MSVSEQAGSAGVAGPNVHPMPGVGPAADGHGEIDRNPGTALELDWIEEVRVNLSAVERRAATLTIRRTVKKDWQAAWLLRAIACIDLTTLSGDDTPGKVKRLCAKARHPVRDDPLAALGAQTRVKTVAANGGDRKASLYMGLGMRQRLTHELDGANLLVRTRHVPIFEFRRDST